MVKLRSLDEIIDEKLGILQDAGIAPKPLETFAADGGYSASLAPAAYVLYLGELEPPIERSDAGEQARQIIESWDNETASGEVWDERREENAPLRAAVDKLTADKPAPFAWWKVAAIAAVIGAGFGYLAASYG